MVSDPILVLCDILSGNLSGWQLNGYNDNCTEETLIATPSWLTFLVTSKMVLGSNGCDRQPGHCLDLELQSRR